VEGGTGSAFNLKGYSNETDHCNCYNFSSLRIKIVLKAFGELSLLNCPN